MNQRTGETNGGFRQPPSLLGFRVHLGSPCMTSLTSGSPAGLRSGSPAGIRAASSSMKSRSPRITSPISASPIETQATASSTASRDSRLLPLTSGGPAALARWVTVAGS